MKYYDAAEPIVILKKMKIKNAFKQKSHFTTKVAFANKIKNNYHQTTVKLNFIALILVNKNSKKPIKSFCDCGYNPIKRSAAMVN